MQESANYAQLICDMPVFFIININIENEVSTNINVIINLNKLVYNFVRYAELELLKNY
jgi:hypothetical protein